MKARAPLLLSGLLALCAPGSEEPASAATRWGCAVGQLRVAVHVGSRLLAAEAGRLELRRGRSLPCADPLAQALQAALHMASAALPVERLPSPLRIHVAPRLPAAEAPVRGVEVHVSSRELLVARDTLEQLPPEAWRHELLHALSAPPPPSSELGRRLWLTLEEGLVQHAAQHGEHRAVAAPSPLPAPAWEQLAFPGYDPHELASGWARELAQLRPALALHAAVDCLSAPAASALDTLQHTALAFAERCPAAVAPVLQQALQRWLPEEWRPLGVPSAAPPGEATFSQRSGPQAHLRLPP